MLDRLAAEKRVVGFEQVSPEQWPMTLGPAGRVLEHPRLPFISHPYEWSFEALRTAGLHHLDIHLEILDAGLTLSDASAYNIQFIGTRPIFIDLLSFRPYRDGEMWGGYRQFCEQFLNPLLFCSATGLMPNAWYRGTLEGISTASLRRLLPWRAKLSRRVLLHVVAHAALEGVEPNGTQASTMPAFPRQRLVRLLGDMRGWIASLTPKRRRSLWSDYSATCSYSGDEREAKRAEVAEFAASTRPRRLWDMGCNTGEYSLLALEAGAERVIGWDGDAAAIDAAYLAARKADTEFTPLVSELANPSPSQGWGQAERAGMQERSDADAVMALALIHHLVFGANVPLPQAMGWIVGLAPRGLIEFVPPDDVQVRPMRARRNGIHHPYDRAAFVGALAALARIEKSTLLGPSGREMFRYDRRH
jgi:ribosomal protein L11 methylase PrmA